MAQKKSNADEDMGLSLTGSQIGTPLSTQRSRPNSAKISNRSTSSQLNRGGSTPKAKPKVPQNGALSGRSELSSARTTGREPKGRGASNGPSGSSKDDFLALFESSSQPKNPRRKGVKGAKPAWASTAALDSARSTSTVDGDQTTHASGSRFSHSVFLPSSARSTSTMETIDNYEQWSNVRPSTETKPKQNMFEEELTASARSSHHHGGNELLLDSQQDTFALKATKLNSIANNMTSQAFSPGVKKTPLMSMENSYQNIKPKMPVNQQVRQAPPPVATPAGCNLAEDYVKMCNMAATRIQRWFRRHGKRRKAGEAALRRMLDGKRQEKEAELQKERNQEKSREEERKRAREEKARQARQQAIQELQRKREQKRLENQRVAEEEIRFLQASGKVTKTPVHKGKKKRVPSRKESDSESEEAASSKPGRSARSSGDVKQHEDSAQPSSGEEAQVKDPSDKGSDTLVLNNTMEASPSQSGSKITLDDLMNTLQKLEEDEKFPTARKDKEEMRKKPFAWLDELDPSDRGSSHSSDHNHFTRLSADKLHKLQQQPGAGEGGASSGRAAKTDNVNKSGLLTDEKLQSIMHYLNEVETAERLSEMDQELSRANDALDRPALLVPSGQELQDLEHATQAASELTQQMLTQKMELEEKRRAAAMLQKALNQQRELTVRHAKETEKEMKKRLDVQKEEYEETIKRHLGFIDQLIDDKKNLSTKCEDMVKELKTISKKYEDKIKNMQEKHDIEMRKLKEVHAAAEKLRREKWMDEKTKKIKEMTVKGLEPEIQRLIAKHKAEVKKLKSIHEAELLASDERAGQRYVRMTEELRDQLAHEKEAACARERELARQTYEKQMQQEEEAYQQQRRRLYAEVQEEKDRQATLATRQRAELDRLQRQLEEGHASSAKALREQYEEAREAQEKRHQNEIRQLKEQLAAEKQAWEENHLKKQDAWAASKERELRESVRRERDREIEMVIQRLEEDNQAAREECQRVADNRIKRIRDKYEAEVAELERSEKVTMEKYNQTKASLAEVEGENERLKVTLRQKDREVVEVKRLLDKLNEERDRVSDVIRQEFADRLVATEEESKRVKTEMSEMKARHRIELDRAKAEVDAVQKAKDEEMEEVHKRVKQAILKKEDVVKQLKQQYEAALKRADHLEGLLEQQRKQLLSKK